MGRLVPVLLRHRRAVLVVWSILCLVGAVLAAGLPGRIVPAGEAPASSQSEVVARALADSALPSLFVSVRVPEGTTPDEQNQVTTTVADAVTGVDGVTHVQPLPAAPPVDAEGAQVTVLAVSTSGGTDGATGTAKALEARLAEVGPEGVALHVGGFGAYRSELAEQSQTDLERAERFGIPIVLIVLLITFGSLWAAGMPLLIALSALLMGLGAVGAASFFLPMSDFVTNAATMIGLALGVDYAMFLVQRVRELVRERRTLDDAVLEAMRTTGTAVLWSGVTVLLAESTLFLVDSRSIRSTAFGMVTVTLFAVVTALVVGPVLISLLGTRLTRGVGRYSSPTRAHLAWRRWSRHVTRRGPVYLVGAVLLMVALTLPIGSLRSSVNIAGTATLPAESSVRHAYADAALRYGAPALSPVVVLVPAREQEQVPQLVDVVTQDAAVLSAVPQPLPDGSTAVVVTERVDPYSPAARDLVDRLRNDPALAGIDHAVGGETAASIDATRALFDSLPKVVLVLLAVVLVLLLASLRSVFLPVKAAVLVLLSLGASLGSLLLLTNTELGARLIGADGVQDINPIVPVTIVAITVALSTDYEVLLMSRIAEHYRRSGDNRAAVASGIEHTGSVITSAAAIMVAVFLGFALADLAPLKQLGVGLAVAVVLDATVVRGVLVPAAMAVMGRGNWWWPVRRRSAVAPTTRVPVPVGAVE